MILSKQEERKNKLLQLPDDETFYVQDARSYVGNSVLWWALNNKGYTTDISRAQKYTKEQVVKEFSKGRDTDIIWIAKHVDANIKSHVDMQDLEKDFKF